MPSQEDDTLKYQLEFLIADYLRDKYLTPPSHSPALSSALSLSLKNNDGEEHVTELVPFVSGSVAVPLVYRGWAREPMLQHAAARVDQLLKQHQSSITPLSPSPKPPPLSPPPPRPASPQQKPAHDAAPPKVGPAGPKITTQQKIGPQVQYMYGLALESAGEDSINVLLGIAWRDEIDIRRFRRENTHSAPLELSQIGQALTRELIDARLGTGLSAKYSLEFSRNLILPSPSLPAGFSSYTIVNLKFPTSLPPATILDHAYTAAIPLATHLDPNVEFDTHLAVAQESTETEVSLIVARLWRSKAQAMQLVPRVPAKLDSKQFEALLKERVATFQGLDANVWSASLGLQLHNHYASANKSPVISVPADCTWISHTSLTFHSWSVGNILAFVAESPFWQSARHHAIPTSALHCSISLLPAIPHTSYIATTHLHESQAAHDPSSAPIHTTSLTVVMGLAWAHTPHPSSPSSSSPSPSPLPTSLVSARTAAAHDIPDLEYLLARLSTSQLPPPPAPKGDSQIGAAQNPQIGELKMSLRHYNVDPNLLSPESRELMWPSLILQKIYLSGEIPAHNYELLSDYGITHIVLCERQHMCVYAPSVNYLKIAPDSDFVAQIKIFVSFVESLGRSNYTILVAGQHGRNRSAALIAGLAMRVGSMSARDAVKLVSARRACVEIEDFILAALHRYEQSLAS